MNLEALKGRRLTGADLKYAYERNFSLLLRTESVREAFARALLLALEDPNSLPEELRDIPGNNVSGKPTP